MLEGGSRKAQAAPVRQSWASGVKNAVGFDFLGGGGGHGL